MKNNEKQQNINIILLQFYYISGATNLACWKSKHENKKYTQFPPSVVDFPKQKKKAPKL